MVGSGSSLARRAQVAADAPELFQLGLMQDRMGLHLKVAQAEVFRQIAQAFAPFDFTPLLFSILVLIDANPGCRQSDLGVLGVKQPNLVDRIDLLAARGLVTRKQDPADRRANVLTLTPEGKRLMGQLKAADDKVTQGFVDRLGERDHRLLVDLLKRLAP